MSSRDSELSYFGNAHLRLGSAAIVDVRGTHTYGELLQASAGVAASLLSWNAGQSSSKKGEVDLSEACVAFQITPGFEWVATFWGILRAGGIAVPLPLNSAAPELEYLLADCGAGVVVADPSSRAQLAPVAAGLGIRMHDLFPAGRHLSLAAHPALSGPGETAELPRIAPERRAMILYTSGTTSRPKGVVSTHANIAAQTASLIAAWEWSESDRAILCLPLHHIHGIVNVVCCALRAGAVCTMLGRFDAEAVWNSIASGNVTVLMAVPTVYVKLIAFWEAASPERRKHLSRACSQVRLMVSGSAALPVSTLERWREITGHTLLERYGMTEIGMALSNPLHGARIPGSVGTPLPGVEVRLAAEGGESAGTGEPGEIEVRGANVFREYWRRPDATRDAFRDGWFRTGDTAVVEDGVYRILGRTSIDILKSGGHKISALEIEEALRAHPAIAECAVVGVPDHEWGERVAAAVVPRGGCEIDLASLRAWARTALAVHKLPSRLLLLESLPRNAMGKVLKPELAARFSGPGVAESGAETPETKR